SGRKSSENARVWRARGHGNVGCCSAAPSPPEGEIHMQRRGSLTLIALAGCLAAALPSIGWAGCGCDKPAPPRASIRPFVAGPTQPVPLFNTALTEGATYDVAFEPQGGPQQWTQARTERRKDIADGEMREHLPVVLPDLPLGPCRVSV